MALPGREFYENWTTPGAYSFSVAEEVEVSFVCVGGGGGGGGNDSQMGGRGGKGAQISGKFTAPANSTVQIYVGAGGPGATWQNPWGPGGTNSYGAGNGGDGGYGHMSGGGGSGGAASIIVLNGTPIVVAGAGAGGGGGGQYSGGYGSNMDADLNGTALNITDGGDGGDVGADSGGGGAGGGGNPGGAGGSAAGWDQDQGGSAGVGGGCFWTGITDPVVTHNDNNGSQGTSNDNSDPGNQIRNAGDGFVTINYAFPGQNSDITISLSDLQTEFGGSNPISISEYYRGGGYVPDTSMNEGVPTSGTISLSDFFGATLINLPGDAEYIDHPDGDGVWRYTATSDFTINVPGDISILMVGGGGRGQTGYAGSGPAGGAGGLVYFETYYLDVGEYQAVVGLSDEDTVLIRNGNHDLTAMKGGSSYTGDGRGGSSNYNSPGSALQNSTYGYGFGNIGGGSVGIVHGPHAGGGAGGAGAPGGNAYFTSSWGGAAKGGAGGDGLTFDITGADVTYAGGGGGIGSYSNNVNAPTNGGWGGAGGGGRGYGRGGNSSTPGVDGLGGGGGGGAGIQPGGSGVIILKGQIMKAI